MSDENNNTPPEDGEIQNMDDFLDPKGADPFLSKAKEPEQKDQKDDPNREEDEEKEKNEDDLNLPSKKTKQESKNTPEQSNAILKKENVKLQESVTKYHEALGGVTPETIKPVMDFLSAKIEGPITADGIQSLVDELKESEDRISEYETKLQDQNKLIEQIDIQQSPEFRDKFHKPYIEAGQDLLLEFAQVSGSGKDRKILAPLATKALQDFIISNIDTIDGLELKAQLTQFNQDYEKEIGEKPGFLPSVSDLMKSVRKLKNAKDERQRAYDNWGETKKKSAEQEAENQTRTEAERQKTNKALRKQLTTKAFTDFDLEDTYSFLDEKEVNKLFNEEYKNGELLFNKEKDIPPYDVMITRGVKAELFDKYAPMLKKIIEQEAERNEGNRHRPSNKGRVNPPNNPEKENDDWMDA